ncbi:MAG: serine/threonine protein phosphatase PrpC [Bradymonadia bacterium]|jgi:serine/threonine protein phosphatase PrpC
MQSVIYIESARGAGEDRAAVMSLADGLIVVVADGAGGLSGGAAVADAACALVRATPQLSPAKILEQLDAVWAEQGEAAVCIVHVARTRVRGAWAGDTFAWQLSHSADRLTPRATARVGSGRVRPRTFDERRKGALLVASDGLWKFVAESTLTWAAQPGGLTVLAQSARLPTNTLRDDIAAVVVR